MKTLRIPGLVATGLLLGFLAAGCQNQPKMLTTGTVDTTMILQSDDEYQALAKDYFKERVVLADQLTRSVKQQGGEIRDQATYDKFKAAERDLLAKWTERTRKFTESRMARICKAAEAVARKKGLDVVLLDSREFQTVEYGAINVTGDILAEMPGLAGGNAQPAAGSPAPEGTR